MKTKGLAGRIDTPTITIKVKVGDKTERVEFPQITIGDWWEIKKWSMQSMALMKEAGEEPVDMWALLMAINSGVDEVSLRGKTKEQKEKIQRKASMGLFGKLDHGIQLIMFHQSLKHDDPEISREDADRIISYGIEDRGQYMRAMMYFVCGLTPEAIAELTESDNPLESNQDTPSEDAQ